MASVFCSPLGLAELDDEDDEGACALGCVVELLELEAGGDCGAIVTDVDEDEGGCVLGCAGAVVDELLELDGLESARGEVWVVDEDEDEDLPGAPAGPGGPCLSQPASAKAPTLKAATSLMTGFFIRPPWTKNGSRQRG